LGGDCDYAAVELSREFAQQLLERIARMKAYRAIDRDLMKLHYACFVPVWFPSSAIMEEDIDRWEKDSEELWDDDYVVPEKPYELKEDNLPRTECDHLVIGAYGDVYFTCYPRHADMLIMSNDIPLELIEKAASEVVTK
jgi:hypothetical protein